MNQILLFFQESLNTLQSLYTWLFTPNDNLSTLLGAEVAPIWVLLGGGLIIIFGLHVLHLIIG